MSRRRQNKFRAKGTHTPDGYFDSKGELKRWGELKLLEKAGEIRDLERQIKFDLIVEGVKVGTYKPDFRYTERETAKPIVEEFKGFWTPQGKLKARLFKALYGGEYEYRVTGPGASTRL